LQFFSIASVLNYLPKYTNWQMSKCKLT